MQENISLSEAVGDLEAAPEVDEIDGEKAVYNGFLECALEARRYLSETEKLCDDHPALLALDRYATFMRMKLVRRLMRPRRRVGGDRRPAVRRER